MNLLHLYYGSVILRLMITHLMNHIFIDGHEINLRKEDGRI